MGSEAHPCWGFFREFIIIPFHCPLPCLVFAPMRDFVFVATGIFLICCGDYHVACTISLEKMLRFTTNSF